MIRSTRTIAHHDDQVLAAEKIRLLMKLRKSGITDTRTLAAIEHTPREEFMSESQRHHAYDDSAVSIEMEQTISQPTVVAWMTQSLDVQDKHVVLEIGTGSGYQAAILSHLCRRVHTIERHKPLYDVAQERFDKLKLRNITPHLGDGSKGWPHAAPYDRIIVTCASDEMPNNLLMQLAEGGVMIVPVGPHVADQQLYKITRQGAEFLAEKLFPVRFVPLVAE
jgi:protein-L-isoaspartate(D-aspartate) O-methyltransferase